MSAATAVVRVLAPLRILMVEDDANDAELLQAHLARTGLGGADILHARTLAEGLALLRARDVQITLLDLDLPDSQGLHTLERVRAAASGPVIVVSGNGHPSLIDEALKRRAYDVIPKDELDAATLQRVLRLALRHRQAGREESASEGRYRALLDSSSEALVLLDAKGRIQYASAAMRRVLGYNSAEILGRAGLGFVQPEDREAVQKAFAELSAEAGSFVTLRVRFQHQNGETRVLECSLANRLGDPEVGAIVSSYRDVSQGVQNEQALRESEQRFRSLLELSSDYFWETDAEHRISLRGSGSRPSAASTFQDGGLGRRRWELPFVSPDMPGWMAHKAMLDAHLSFRDFEFSRPMADGSERHFAISGEPVFDAAGQFSGYRGVGTDTTERKRSDEAQRRFRAGMDASADMILLIDHKTMRYVDVNETVCRTLGYSREEMLRMGPHDLLPASREELKRTYDRFIADPGTIHGMNSLYRCKDGTTIPFESTRRLLHSEDGPIIVAISRDIRKRLETEQALRQSEERFRSLTELSADWYWEQDAELRFVTTGGHAKGRGGITAAQHEGLRRWELPGTEPLEGGWDEHRALLEAHRPFRDFMLKRIGNDGTVHYVSVSGEPIFDNAGAFQGYRGVAKDVTQSVEAVVALRESEERFRNLTALSSDWYWEQDAEFRFTKVGVDPSSAVYGSAETALGKARWELPITPLNCTWEAHRETLQSHRTFREFEYSYPGADGKPRYVSASGYPIVDADGRCHGYRGVAKDITARKLSEEQLRRFRAALDSSADSMYLIDVDSLRIIDANDATARNLGYEREELLGKDAAELFVDRTRDDLRAAYDRLLEDGLGEELLRTQLRRKDGSGVPVEITRRGLRTPDGRYIIGIARDLTERLRSEERLRSSHERFEMVSRATNDVVWDWNLVTDQVWWNENFQKLFGYEPREIGAYVDSWTSRIHPEDLGRVKSQVDTAIANGAKAWAGEYRFRCKDGGYVDVYDRGLLMHDAAGRAVRMIGAMMDVSERKHAESRMRVHAERQAAIARFGQFALGRRSTEELYAEAARALRCEGVDAVWLLEVLAGQGEFVVRAAQGEGPHVALGMRGAVASDSVWPELLRDNSPRIAGRPYLASRPLDRPWRAWVRAMGSAVYVPVRDDEKPIAMLCMYALGERAFGAEDVRFAESVGHVLSTALQRQKAERRLSHLAQFDALTGLPNRTLLQDRLAQTIVQSRRKRRHAGVLFVDLDRFKLINDTLGHHQGDELIRQVGERLQGCVRASDTVGRISGDEFAVVLAELARPDDAALVAQKILDVIARPFDLGGNEAYIGASIGIAAFPEDGDDAETLLKNADIAMYRAKEQGRNSYRFFTAEMNQRTVAKAALNTDLRRAIERREFELHYQPKVDLADGHLRGLEALLRWNHPQRGLVSPGEFIPALEDSGLILPVGAWVIDEACAQQRRWRDAGLAPVPVAVNLSPKQFRRGDLDRIIRQTLGRTGIGAELLELEITESCLMEDPEDAVRVMHNLRAAGLKISIDDFGTGYSSLSYLTRLPLSALKIDRSFVRDAGASAEAASIVRAVIDMAQNLRFTVIAEGVETEQQVAFLRKHGCNQAQGYFFGRPASAQQTAALLARA